MLKWQTLVHGCPEHLCGQFRFFLCRKNFVEVFKTTLRRDFEQCHFYLSAMLAVSSELVMYGDLFFQLGCGSIVKFGLFFVERCGNDSMSWGSFCIANPGSCYGRLCLRPMCYFICNRIWFIDIKTRRVGSGGFASLAFPPCGMFLKVFLRCAI